MIKVTIGEKPQGEVKPFPKLMIASSGWAKGSIVLFIKQSEGFLIVTAKEDDTIDYAANWNMEHFTDYNEPVTIQNA